MNDRIQALQQMMVADPGNSFLRYGLAMAMVNAGALDDAVGQFRTLVAADPNYSAAYYHGGQTMEKLGNLDDARNFYRQGLEVTKDSHARAELQAALDILGD